MTVKTTYRTVLVVIALLACTSLYSQRTLFLEVGGSGGLGSINYEKMLSRPMRKVAPDASCGTPDPSRYIISLRAGLGFSPIDKNNGVVLVFPLMGNVIYGLGKHKLEGGLGFAPSVTTRGAFYIKSPLMLGYRYEPSGNNLFFRVNYTPIVGWWFDYQWQHWAGFSIGYKLKTRE